MPESVLVFAAALIGGYLLGSIPFGVIATRLGGAGDLRSIGSGNIGATNVLRTGRRDLALLTLIGDGGKGAVAVGLATMLAQRVNSTESSAVVAVAAAAAFLGHLFPVWLRFKGGKGVATFFGTMLAAAWPIGLISAAAWLVVAGLARISSLAALVAVAVAPMAAFALGLPRAIALLAMFMALLVFIRHEENIRRLIRGEEPRIGAAKPPPASTEG